MNHRRLIGLGVIAVLVSAIIGDFAHRVIFAAIFAAMFSGTDVGDTTLMMQGFLMAFVYRPIVSVACAVLVLALSWRIVIRATPISEGTKALMMFIVIVLTLFVSFVWVYVEAF